MGEELHAIKPLASNRSAQTKLPANKTVSVPLVHVTQTPARRLTPFSQSWEQEELHAIKPLVSNRSAQTKLPANKPVSVPLVHVTHPPARRLTPFSQSW